VNRLAVRLLASYAVVIAVGVLTVFLTVRLLAPYLFDDHIGMHGTGGMGMGMGGGTGAGTTGSQLHDAFSSALDTALLLGLLASAVAAEAVGAFVARRLLRPIEAVRHATRRLAQGSYTERIPLPREAELAALAGDVNHLAGALADTEQRRVRLISEVAHEMRTPLTTVDGYLEGLLDGVFAPTPEVLNAISDEVARLRRLATDLTALSRAEEGALDLHLAAVDLAGTARSAAERLRPQFDDAGLTLDLHLPAALPVRADEQRLAQVLTNLVGNALSYTPAGGRISVTGGRAGATSWVAVTDTGIGLTADQLSHVFERFYRARRDSPHAGSGIGLTIARGIARAHGGEVTASSPGPGHGATFTFTLPSHLPARDQPPPPPPPPAERPSAVDAPPSRATGT
jgi:signal transduction histidine kinase